jgi:hypothetical protein
MPEARKTPAEWIKEITTALTPGGINTDIKAAWNLLKTKTVFDGVWHKEVKEKVVVPYNTIYGGWASSTIVKTKTYQGVSSANAKGSPYWVRGLVMPRGFDSILGVFDNNTAGVFKSLWQTGSSGDRGSEKLGGVELAHKRIGVSRSTDRLWYLSDRPYTCYLVSEHVDSTANGKRELGRIDGLVTAWVKDSDTAIEVGFLKMPTTVSTMYVIT